jgi:hypothetical protein
VKALEAQFEELPRTSHTVVCGRTVLTSSVPPNTPRLVGRVSAYYYERAFARNITRLNLASH